MNKAPAAAAQVEAAEATTAAAVEAVDNNPTDECAANHFCRSSEGSPEGRDDEVPDSLLGVAAQVILVWLSVEKEKKKRRIKCKNGIKTRNAK